MLNCPNTLNNETNKVIYNAHWGCFRSYLVAWKFTSADFLTGDRSFWLQTLVCIAPVRVTAFWSCLRGCAGDTVPFYRLSKTEWHYQTSSLWLWVSCSCAPPRLRIFICYHLLHAKSSAKHAEQFEHREQCFRNSPQFLKQGRPEERRQNRTEHSAGKARAWNPSSGSVSTLQSMWVTCRKQESCDFREEPGDEKQNQGERTDWHWDF